MDGVRRYNIGASDYAQHIIQPWDLWIIFNFNPFEGDIAKRTLRIKSTDSRVMDYQKMKHISKECIRQIDIGEYNYLPISREFNFLEEDKSLITIDDIKESYPNLQEFDYRIIKSLLNIKFEITKQWNDNDNPFYPIEYVRKEYQNIVKQCNFGIEWENIHKPNLQDYEPKTGDIVRHFKNEIVDDKSEYLYEIIGVGFNSETKEKYVVYKSLYSIKDIEIGHICCRPYDMFLSEVDHKKYPNIKQKYRFEKVR